MKTLSFHKTRIGRSKDRVLMEVDTPSGDPEFFPGLHLIVAPNGRGKTTLLQTLGGVLPRLGGEIWWGEKTLNPQKDVIYVSEYLAFPKYVFPAEWIEFVAGRPVPVNLAGDLARWVKGFSLEGKVASYLGRMSQGERRKVTWLAAHVSNRSLVLLDEPLDGLDLLAIRAAREMIQDWKSRGRVMIVVAHQVAEMLDLADSVVLIDQNRLIDWKKTGRGEPSEVDPHRFRSEVLEFYGAGELRA